MDEGRIPPQAIDVEMLVLGCIISDVMKSMSAFSMLEPRDFYKPAHNKIFAIMVSMFNEGIPIDTVTVSESLGILGQLDEIGGPMYLSDLTMEVTSAANIVQYCKIVKERAIKRDIIRYGSEIVDRAFDSTEDGLDLIEQVQDQVFEIQRPHENSAKSSLALLNDELSSFEMRRSGQQPSDAILYGYPDLEAKMGGLRPKDLIILAARPSMGKTALALCMSWNASKKIPTAFMSIEMSKELLAMRLMSILSGVKLEVLKDPRYANEAQVQAIRRSVAELEEYSEKFIIDDGSSLSLPIFRSKVKQMKAEHGTQLFFIDYLQFMELPRGNESREQKIGMITRGLKLIAKQEEISIVLLCQLNRDVEQRKDKKPMLADLRESGNIEQDADVVMLLYRPEWYGIEQYPNGESTTGTAEIIIAKHRNGATGSAKLGYETESTNFRPLYSLFSPME